MGRTVEEYQKLFINLLPPGKIWNTLITSVLGKLLKGMGDEFVRIEGRSEDLINIERDVQTTDELLEDHENDWGLPEENEELEPTIALRRNKLYAKFITVGRSNAQYFIDIAKEYGYTVTIEEFTPFWVGTGTVNQPIGAQTNIFYWRVMIEILDGVSMNIDVLKNAIFRLKQSQTQVLFGFSGIAYDRGFDTGFDSLPFWDDSGPNKNGYNVGYSSGYESTYNYDGVFLTGAYHPGFSLGYERHSGGGFTRAYTNGYSRME